MDYYEWEAKKYGCGVNISVVIGIHYYVYFCRQLFAYICAE